MVCHLHSNWEKLFFKLNECYLLSIELLQFYPPMILVLLLNSYAVWRSNWYFHINFSQICEHFWQLLKLLKIASLTMHIKYVGTFPVIIISKTGNLPPLPPWNNVEFWAQWVEMSPFDVTDVTTLSGGGGGVGLWRDEPKAAKAGPKRTLLLGIYYLDRVLPPQWRIEGRGLGGQSPSYF